MGKDSLKNEETTLEVESITPSQVEDEPANLVENISEVMTRTTDEVVVTAEEVQSGKTIIESTMTYDAWIKADQYYFSDGTRIPDAYLRARVKVVNSSNKKSRSKSTTRLSQESSIYEVRDLAGNHIGNLPLTGLIFINE